MRNLEPFERKQSGVIVIKGWLEEMKEEARLACTTPQDQDPIRDSLKTQWYRAQHATVLAVLDRMKETGDYVMDGDGAEQEGER